MRINDTSRTAVRRGLTLTMFDIDALTDKSDRKFFWQATQPGHSLTIFSLLKLLPTVLTNFVRDNIHPYLLPNVQYSQFKNWYSNRCLFKYV